MNGHTVYLLLGSNLGDRLEMLARAVGLIGDRIGRVDAGSPLYETASWGNTALPAFVNQVIRVDTGLPARAVLERNLAIERELGRARTEKWGSRTIDIDILFYDDAIIDEDGLSVPHPQLHLRKFTLVPLSGIDPQLVHPVLGKTVAELLAELDDPLPVVLIN